MDPGERSMGGEKEGEGKDRFVSNRMSQAKKEEGGGDGVERPNDRDFNDNNALRTGNIARK